MNFKTSCHGIVLFLIFLNLSIVCAGSNDNLTVIEPSFDEFNDVDVIYAGDVVEINGSRIDTSEGPFLW